MGEKDSGVHKFVFAGVVAEARLSAEELENFDSLLAVQEQLARKKGGWGLLTFRQMDEVTAQALRQVSEAKSAVEKWGDVHEQVRTKLS